MGVEFCNQSLAILLVNAETGDLEYIPALTPYMSTLDLEAAGVVDIHPGSFLETGNILRLNLARNKIHSLYLGTFNGLYRLEHLNLSSNPLVHVEEGAFINLTQLQELDLRSTDIVVTKETTTKLFTGLQNLEILHADRYVFCCLAQLDPSQCNAPRDQFSSCTDLMAHDVLRIFIWILGGSAFVGNAFVVIYRIVNRRRDKKQAVQASFITHLAISDFMMGLYMITIAAADVYYRGNYATHADEWQGSIYCKVAGIVSVVSSEVSVCLIMLISLDRCINIVVPFKKGLHLTPKGALIAELSIWLLGFIVAILPVIIPEYVEGRYYGQSGVCLALPLTVNRPSGWYYSISLFIGANFVAFLVTLLCYIIIYMTFQHSRKQISRTGKGSNDEKRLLEDIKLAWKMLIIVGTDLICWLPIIIMGLMSAAGKLTISAQVYAWTAVFVLPVNSSLNPYLYTLSTLQGNKKKSQSSQGDDKTRESSVWTTDTASIISPFSDLPKPAPVRLPQWLAAHPRSLSQRELSVISSDVTHGYQSAVEAGYPGVQRLQAHNVAVLATESGSIHKAFFVLDSSLAFLETAQPEANGVLDSATAGSLAEVQLLLKELKLEK